MVERPQPLVNYNCLLGENPLWDDQRQVLYWTDIDRGRIYEYDPARDYAQQIYSGDPVGGFTLETDGSLLLFQANRVSTLTPDREVELYRDEIDGDMKRFNDVIADPEGRVYAGTIGLDDQKGGLYLLEPGGEIRSLFKGTGISNGMGWSPDEKTFYWTCSTSRRIYRFDYNRKSGEIENQQPLIEIGAHEGLPDGLAVDSEGTLWSARYGGYGVYHYSPEGAFLRKIDFPVEKVTSLAFGGRNLDELYVTTAGGAHDRATEDGALFRFLPGTQGRAENRSRILG